MAAFLPLQHRDYAEDVSPDRFWTSRLRWRLRGATQWPAFVVCTLLDGLLLDMLPPSVLQDPNLLIGVLIATFGNLVLIGAAAPLLTRRLLRRRQAATIATAPTTPPPEAEREVLQDRVASALLAAGLVATLVSGLANRPVIVSETAATEEVGRELRDYVNRSGSEELQRNLETANTIRLSEGYFRVCIARDDRRRNLCLFVDTDKEPTETVRDPSAEPNSAFAGRGASSGR
jgi:hypothetical protein